MPTEVVQVSNSPDFPTEVDVVVVGAGIVGTCTAYELARKGVSVCLIDKGIVGGEQSSRNWGWVRQQNRDLHELPLAMYSLRRWGEFGEELGRDVGFRREGILYCTRDRADLERWERWGQGARALGFESQILTAAETKARGPNGSPSWLGGVWSPTDGKAEPSIAAPAIAEGAKALGVSLHQHCAARGLDITNGRVSGVWTERGLVKAGGVVFAGGAWTSRFCRRYGIDVPVANIGGTAMQTTPAPDVLGAGCVHVPGLAIRRRIDDSYTLAVPGYGTLSIAPQGIRYATKFYRMYRAKVAKKLTYRLDSGLWNGPEAWGGWHNDKTSPFEKIRVLDPTPDNRLADQAIETLVRHYPALQGISIARTWGGMIDTSPDLIPVISRTEHVGGLVIASSFSGHGFAIGPGAGRLASELVMDEQPFTDPTPYRLDRFSDGSAIRPAEMM